MNTIPGLHHFINGRDIAADGAGERLLLNPATEAPLWQMPLASGDIVATAVASARKASKAWGQLSPAERAAVLHRCAAHMRSNIEEIAGRISLENGKPIAEARIEALITSEEIGSGAELATQLRTGKQTSQLQSLSFQHARPRGVVACIMPWNYPLLTVLAHVFAALSVDSSVASRKSYGGTAPDQVRAQIAAARKALGMDQ